MSSQPPVDTVKHCTSHVACNHTTPLVFETMFRPFYPVRYVYTQRLEQDQTLPEPPPLRELACTELEKTNDFIARVLRPGWLYVREENGTEDFLIFEYSRKDNNGVIEEHFDRYVFTDGKTAKSGLKPASQYESTGIGSFPFVNRNVTEISIRYSEDEWSSETIDQVHQNEQARSQSMKRITLTGQDRTTIDLTHENLQSMVEEYRTDDERVKPSADQLYAVPHEVVGRSRSMAEKLRDVKRAMVVALDDPEGWEEPPVEYYAVYPMRLFVELDGEEELAKEYDPDVVSGENKEELAEKLKTLKWQTTSLSDGYLYVFVDGYLYQEFKVLCDSDEKALYHEVDLSKGQGKDQRLYLKGLKMPLVTVPVDAQSVQIGFSTTQWSWLRINTLGGIAPASAFPKAAIATDTRTLASNDARLEESNEQNAQQLREKRLQAIHKQDEDYLSWHTLEAPGFYTDPCYAVIPDEFRDHITETNNIRTDEYIIEVAVPVLHDHLSIIRKLMERYGVLIDWMNQLTTHLQDKNNPDKKHYPYTEHFESASKLYHELMIDGDKSAESYYRSTVLFSEKRDRSEEEISLDRYKRQQIAYRNMVHLNSLRLCLGIDYRRDLRVLLKIAHQQLTGFITQSASSSSYPSLTESLQSRWSHQLQDSLASPYEAELQVNRYDQTVAEEFFEFVGQLIHTLCCDPEGIDRSFEENKEEIERQKRAFLEHEAVQWVRNTFSETNNDDDLWPSLMRGQVIGVQTDDPENDLFMTTTGFQVVRRGIQAISSIVSGLLTSFAFQAEDGDLTARALMKRYTGAELHKKSITEALDIQLLDNIDQADYGHAIRAQSLTISQFLTRYRPLVLDKLGGPTASDIDNQGKEDEKILRENLDDERQSLEEQAEWSRNDNETTAHSRYKDKMEALEEQRKGLETSVESQREALAKHNHDFNQRAKAWENELATEQTTMNEHLAARDEAQRQYREAKAVRDQYHQQSVSAYADLNRVRQQKTQLQQLLEGSAAAGQDTSSLEQQLSSINSDETRLQSQLDTATEQARNGSDLTKALKSPLDAAEEAYGRSQSTYENHQHKFNVAKDEHERIKKGLESDLDATKQELKTFNEETYDQRSTEAGEHRDKRIDDFNADKQAELDQHDAMAKDQIKAKTAETNGKIRERHAQVKAHKAENAERRAAAEAEGRDVFDLSNPEEAKAWENYSGHLLKQRFVVVPDDQVRELVIQKIKLKAQVRSQNGEDALEVNQTLYNELSARDRYILDSTFVSKSLYDKFEQQMRSTDILLLDADEINTIEKRMLRDEARSLSAWGDIDWPLNGMLGAFELFNLWGAAQAMGEDKSTYSYANFLATVLDVAASIEALIKTNMSPPPAAKFIPRMMNAWRFARLGVMANALTMFFFAYDMVKARDKNDDVWIGYAIAASGSALLAMKSIAIFGAGALASGVGVVAFALMALGVFLARFVFRENSGIREHVLTYGPFGAKIREGKPLVNITHHPQMNVLFLEWADLELGVPARAMVDARTLRLLNIEALMQRDENHQVIPGYSTYEPLGDDGHYIYLIDGSLRLGHIGEAVGDGKLKDMSDFEQYIKAPFQQENSRRFTSDDTYTDEDLKYVVEPSDWQGNGAGHAYYEAVISALYPLQLELEVGPKRVVEYGHYGKRKFGNVLRVKYRVPFYQEVVSEVKLLLHFENDVSTELDLSKLLKQSVESTKNYIKTYNQDGFNIVELNLDHSDFLSAPDIGRVLSVGDRIMYKAVVYCQHKIGKRTIHQPPLLKHDGHNEQFNFASTKKETIHNPREDTI